MSASQIMSRFEEEARQGYADQTAWLQGKSLPEAWQALREREATLGPGNYNAGGNRATREYIQRCALLAADETVTGQPYRHWHATVVSETRTCRVVTCAEGFYAVCWRCSYTSHSVPSPSTARQMGAGHDGQHPSAP